MTVQHTGAWVSASWALLLIFLSYCLPPVYLWLISDQWDMGYPKFRCTARRHHNPNKMMSHHFPSQCFAMGKLYSMQTFLILYWLLYTLHFTSSDGFQPVFDRPSTKRQSAAILKNGLTYGSCLRQQFTFLGIFYTRFTAEIIVSTSTSVDKTAFTTFVDPLSCFRRIDLIVHSRLHVPVRDLILDAGIWEWPVSPGAARFKVMQIVYFHASFFPKIGISYN